MTLITADDKIEEHLLTKMYFSVQVNKDDEKIKRSDNKESINSNLAQHIMEPVTESTVSEFGSVSVSSNSDSDSESMLSKKSQTHSIVSQSFPPILSEQRSRKNNRKKAGSHKRNSVMDSIQRKVSIVTKERQSDVASLRIENSKLKGEVLRLHTQLNVVEDFEDKYSKIKIEHEKSLRSKKAIEDELIETKVKLAEYASEGDFLRKRLEQVEKENNEMRMRLEEFLKSSPRQEISSTKDVEREPHETETIVSEETESRKRFERCRKLKEACHISLSEHTTSSQDSPLSIRKICSNVRDKARNFHSPFHSQQCKQLNNSFQETPRSESFDTTEDTRTSSKKKVHWFGGVEDSLSQTTKKTTLSREISLSSIDLNNDSIGKNPSADNTSTFQDIEKVSVSIFATDEIKKFGHGNLTRYISRRFSS